MTPQTLTCCLELLEGMPSASTWSPAVGAVFAMAMEGWADDVAIASVREAVLTLRWRPSPAELREIALARSVPAALSPGAALEELRRCILWHGERSRKEAKTDALVHILADELGGWSSVCRMYSDELERLFPKAYDRAVADRAKTIGDEVLSLSPGKRRREIASTIGNGGAIA